MNRFGHMDLRVTDLAAAAPFYEALMTALGYVRTYHGHGWHVYATEDALPGAAYVAVTEAPDHVPNANRVAFWSPDDADVDRIAAIVKAAGARDMEGPAAQPYGPGPYYAVYFTDPCGNRFEVYCRQAPPETYAVS